MLSEILGGALGETNLPGVTAIRHPLRKVDSNLDDYGTFGGKSAGFSPLSAP
jgi:hypothetical protein